MSDKRKDNKGRILHNGEVQLADGRYRFKFVNLAGKEKYVYSWRLTVTDEAHNGRRCLSLREMEKQVQVDMFDHIVPNGGKVASVVGSFDKKEIEQLYGLLYKILDQ